MEKEELLEESWLWFSERLDKMNERKINPIYRSTYGYIWGTSIALQESLAHLVNTDPRLAKPRMALLPKSSFKEYVGQDGFVRWQKSKRMHMYSCEFYLNKAQSNIAACVDTILNQWMMDRLPPPFEGDTKEVLYNLLFLFMPSRMRIVSAIRTGQERMKKKKLPASILFPLLEHQWPRFDEIYNPERAAAIVQVNVPVVTVLVETGKFANVLPKENADTPYLIHVNGQGVSSPLRMTDALCIMSGRVNAYKHLPDGHTDRQDNFHYAEWAITARAFACLCELFHDKIRSVPRRPSRRTQKKG